LASYTEAADLSRMVVPVEKAYAIDSVSIEPFYVDKDAFAEVLPAKPVSKPLRKCVVNAKHPSGGFDIQRAVGPWGCP
jgi:hypothetical protein